MTSLTGRRVLVTRPTHQAAALACQLRARGATPILWAALAIEPPADRRPLLRAARQLDQYDWVVVTSANGAAALMSALAEGGPVPVPERVRFAAIGPATAAALQAGGIVPALLPTLARSEGLLAALGECTGRVLLASAANARPVLAEGLRQQGALVTAVEAYRVVPQPLPAPLQVALRRGEITDVVLTSGTAARALAAGLAGSPLVSRVICLGPVTAAAARRAGLPVHRVAREASEAGLLAALEERP
ncbi:MAG: hypothetical protein KatS3mg061_1883 [Dehalococcoidia bacterium]|nr:MAG: hypothetical protein KatS3mg061_1883 [Dehalococcoidia bacterium]